MLHSRQTDRQTDGRVNEWMDDLCQILFFSDEKIFVIDPAFNPQNDRWIRFEESEDEEDSSDDDAIHDAAGDAPSNAAGNDSSGRYIERSKHPASAMFLGASASTGEVSPTIWIHSGFRLDADAYIKALRQVLTPWMRKVSLEHGSAPLIFQPDSAPAHRAIKTRAFLQEEKIAFWSPHHLSEL